MAGGRMCAHPPLDARSIPFPPVGWPSPGAGRRESRLDLEASRGSLSDGWTSTTATGTPCNDTFSTVIYGKGRMFPSERISERVSNSWSVMGVGTGTPPSFTPMKMYPGARWWGRSFANAQIACRNLFRVRDRYFALHSIRFKVGNKTFELLNFRHMRILTIVGGLGSNLSIRHTRVLGNLPAQGVQLRTALQGRGLMRLPQHRSFFLSCTKPGPRVAGLKDGKDED